LTCALPSSPPAPTARSTGAPTAIGTLLGAVYGYNAMLDAIGRPDWRLAIDPNAWHDRVFRTGDLPAMAGLEPRDEHALVEERFEQAPLLRTAILGVRFANKPPFVVEGKKPGPTVLLIGDSYTEDPMAPLFPGSRRAIRLGAPRRMCLRLGRHRQSETGYRADRSGRA
jgi:hypothetical protein